MILSFSRSLLVVFLLILFSLGCSKNDNGGQKPVPENNLFEQIQTLDSLSLFSQALERASLVAALQDSSNLTIFAPENEAFRKAGLDEAGIAGIDTDSLRELLRYHILPGILPSKSMPEGPNAPLRSLEGSFLFISNFGDSIYVNGASLFDRDIRSSNGVIHTISRVLQPPAKTIGGLIAADSDLSLLRAAIENTSNTDSNFVLLLDTLTAFSFFAPNNAAFQTAGYADIRSIENESPDSLVKLLSAHLVNGFQFASNFIDSSYIKPVNGNLVLVRKNAPFRLISQSDSSVALVQKQDILASNGILYQIDGILR